MKIYTLTVTIEEGCDEFWEEMKDRTGCDEITKAVKDALWEHGFQDLAGTKVVLTKFEEVDE